MKTPEKTMIDSMGVAVPLRYIPKHDRDRDRIVQRIFKRWTDERKRLEKVMVDTLSDLEKILDIRIDAGGAASEKGNLQVRSFDGLTTVSLRVNYEIVLNDRVRQARQMMLDYARSVAGRVEGTDGQFILELIDEAFQVSSTGNLSQGRVLSLMNRNIKAKPWRDAVELLRESIETRRGKSYLRVEHRKTRQRDPEAILLDIANCWPDDTTLSAVQAQEGQEE